MSKQIPEHIILELLKDCKNNQDLLGENGLLANLHSQIMDYAIKIGLNAPLEGIDDDDHSDYAFLKSLNLTQKQAIELKDEIISLYSRGMIKTDIQAHFSASQNIHLTTRHINSIINKSESEMELWRGRELDSIYPIVYLDAMRILVKENNIQRNKSVHIVLGINLEGRKEVLGLWIAHREKSDIWANILTELKNRGVKDIFIVCCDNLSGLTKSIKSLYPHSQIQLCVLHQKRASLACVAKKDKKILSNDLAMIYTAPTLQIAEKRLSEMAEKWQENYPAMVKSWYHNWENLTPFYEYIPELRKVLYTTNMIESLNSQLRKVAKKERVFGSDQIALNALYLYLEVARKKWTMPIAHWQLILNQFKLLFEERLL
ncbi:MAG: IS256 family transposase [Moraxella sp.]|uniref:IS256 family transposase n=1 Tax=Moraxella sp. TaxID=479 RepID=UPI0026DB741F|nr:IS256 family transposase [Moraxella sp.]MDO4450165.1 IS256 family transposase [Moraxella sp.]